MSDGSQERLTLITEAAKILSNSLQSPFSLQRLADLIASTIADVCAIEILRDDGQRERVAIAFPKDVEDVEAILAGSEFQPDPVFHVPLPMDGGTLGDLILVRLGGSMNIGDLELADDLGRMTALSLENARLYQRAQEALLRVRNQAASIRQMNEQLERRVAERTLQLEAANQQMSMINYTVSHDLRAPLRAIQGYSQILMDDFGESLPPEAREFIQKLCKGTSDVNQLLDGLLNFCKFSGHPLQRQDVRLEEIVSQALETLRPQMAGRKIDLRIGQFDTVFADSLLVKQVFVNLLSNALTYTASKDIAVIEVGQFRDPDSNQPVVFVKDNGIGFDPRDEAKLFEPFRRLHADQGYEGTGIGLSIVAGIVLRHGGRIWAAAAPNAGATFYFTLAASGRERLVS